MNLENSGYLWLLLVIPCFLYYSFISYKRASNWLYRFAHSQKAAHSLCCFDAILKPCAGCGHFFSDRAQGAI